MQRLGHPRFLWVEGKRVGCTNPGRQVAVITKLLYCVPNVCGYSVRNLIRVTILALRILRWFLDFWQIFELLI